MLGNILKLIDAVGDWTGKIVCWLSVLLVGLVSLEVFMRYVLDSPTMWNFETSMMVGGVLCAMGWSYAERKGSHVRIDFIYGRLPTKGKATIDVLGTVLIFLPLMTVFTYTAIGTAWNSWVINEKGVDTYWYPPMAPFRMAVALGFVLLFLQCGARFVRDIHLLIRGKIYD